MFTLSIIGCGSATPSLRHLPSAQIVNHRNRLFMVDCGEGAQLQMRRMKIKYAHIRHIFISHLHGDHMLGLPGLLSTLSLHGLEGDVHVYMMEEGIAWLKEFMRISRHHASLQVVFHPIRREHATLYEDDSLTVESIPLYHGVPTVGFIFREKPKPRRIIGDMVEYYGVPPFRREALRRGEDYIRPDGTVVPNAMLTRDPEPPASYAYCSDTMFRPEVIESVRGVTTLYHEATYADDKAAKARERYHSTARQAGIVAREAGARRLVLGHYSKSYPDESQHLSQALEEFPEVELANEGNVINLEIK